MDELSNLFLTLINNLLKYIVVDNHVDNLHANMHNKHSDKNANLINYVTKITF